MADNNGFSELPPPPEQDHNQVYSDEPEDFRDTLLFKGGFFIACMIALVFFSDTLQDYGVGPRGSDTSCMSLHTLVIILAVVYGFMTLLKLADWLSNR